MADWYNLLVKANAEKLIKDAEQGNIDYITFLKQAAKKGVSEDPDVQSYAGVLKEAQQKKSAEGRQMQISGAVDLAKGQQLKGINEAATLPPREFVKRLEANPQNYQGYETPQNKEQFMGAMGRSQFSPDVTANDIAANPNYALTSGQFPSVADELAKSRLKMQQDAEARKKDQINRNIDNQDLKAKIASDRLSFDYLKLDVSSREAREASAERLRNAAVETDSKQLEKTAELKKWKQIQKDMADGDQTALSDYTPEQVNGQIAQLESLVEGLKENAKVARERSKELASQSVFEAKTGKKPKPTAANTPPPEAAAPTENAGNMADAVLARRKKYNIPTPIR